MKRLGLVTLLLLGGVLNAYADNDIYNNITKRPRGDDALQADTNYCSEQFGAPQNGTVTPRPYKTSMLAHAWRFSPTVRPRAARDNMYPDLHSPGRWGKDCATG